MRTKASDLRGDPSTRYVFRIEFRLHPAATGLSVSPDRFEAVLYRRADPPGEDVWLFFRDALWLGDLADADHFRELAEASLGVAVTAASFSELQTDEAYLGVLRGAVADDLDEFRADSVDGRFRSPSGIPSGWSMSRSGLRGGSRRGQVAPSKSLYGVGVGPILLVE